MYMNADIKCPKPPPLYAPPHSLSRGQLCSVSLSNNNVYACLVCGKYFQGRGRNTHAYTHSVQHAHHVFINLRTCRVYCLPDSYEVVDSSLEDIKRALDPRYSPEGIKALDKVRAGGGNWCARNRSGGASVCWYARCVLRVLSPQLYLAPACVGTHHVSGCAVKPRVSLRRYCYCCLLSYPCYTIS